MEEQAVHDRPLSAPPAAVGPRQGRGRVAAAGEYARAYPWLPWLLTAIGLIIVSTVIVRLAGTRPGYDPYGWLVWGKLTIHGHLDTNGAPSWKPLAFVFTVPYALFGHYAMWLWMITAVAVSLSGAIFAWRIAWRLVDAPPHRRYAGYAAGLFAVAGVFGIVDYSHFVLSAQSDTMIVALCLAAIDCWMAGRQRWALAAWVLGSLGRPEVWPFLLVHAIWCWRHDRALRPWVIGGLVLIPLGWLGVPAVSAKTVFVASDNALHSPRELHGSKIPGTLHRFADQQTWPLEIVAALGVLQALLRPAHARNRLVLLMAGGVVLWVAVEVAFALHGFPAVPRYLFEAVGAMGVLAGVAVGRFLVDGPELAGRIAPRIPATAAAWAAGIVALAFAGALVPVARARYDTEHRDLIHERARAREIGRLQTVIARLGRDRILACGTPNVPIEYQSVFAWYMDVKIGALYVTPKNLVTHPRTVVDFYPLSNGWHVLAAHVSPPRARRCAGVHLRYRS